MMLTTRTVRKAQSVADLVDDGVIVGRDVLRPVHLGSHGARCCTRSASRGERSVVTTCHCAAQRAMG